MPLIAELKRRNVFRVGAAYAIVGWLLVEVASVVLPTFEAPEWIMKAFTFLVILGFPLTLVIAWAFELTPEGIKREEDAEPATPVTQRKSRNLRRAALQWAGMLSAVVVLLGLGAVLWHLVGRLAGDHAANAPPIRSLAVLPFDNISPDPDDAYFADGIHDEVLAQLSKIRDLKVISRTSVMGYRGDSRPPLPEIAAALDVANILEGSVRLAGNRVRITAQLIEAKSDAHLWTETYDRELTAANIFSIQSDVAKTVAAALRAALSPQEKQRLETAPTNNMAALKAYFRGKQRMEKRTSAALAEAVDDFERAIELDPSFALAYVGLADSYILQASYSGLPSDEMIAKAQAATDKALALDDRLAESYTSLGAIERERNDYEASEAAFQRALELNPNYATAYHWYAEMLSEPLFGRDDEALELIEKAAELDPRSPIILLNAGLRYASVGRLDESLAWYRKSIEIDPDFARGYFFIGYHYLVAEGRLYEAVRWIRNAVSVDPQDPDADILGWVFLDLGDLDRAEYWIKRSTKLMPNSFFRNFSMQLLHLYQGDLPAALEYGRRAFETEAPWAYGFKSFEPVRIHEMRAGHYLEARAAFERIAPELLNEDFPRIESKNYRAAIDLALISSKIGEQQRADRLLESSLRYVQQIPRLGLRGHFVADVEIFALKGEKQKALSALRRAIDEGWRAFWWYYLKFDPTLESLHDEPEYLAMVAEIEADMAEQLERVHEMERNGELEPIPELAME